jgi:acyl-CoA carboxylase subunit beta
VLSLRAIGRARRWSRLPSRRCLRRIYHPLTVSASATLASARDRVALVADPGSLEVWDDDVVSRDPLRFSDTMPYAERLAAARARVGVPEAVLTGRVTVAERPLVVVASEFGFLGGSIGTATGERVVRAIERAREARLPVLILPASGGTRMQEGTPALMQMAKIAAAVRRLLDAGLTYIAYLTHPTMGGVLASWGSLGVATFAMPGALIGFAGPRVVEMLTGRRLPAGVQSGEHLFARGLVDDVVAPAELRERVLRVLAVTTTAPEPPRARTPLPGGQAATPVTDDAWSSVLHARNPLRPSAVELLRAWATDITVLRGDGAGGGEDPACLAALARLRGVPAVVVAQHRDRDGHGPSRMGPAGYRKARRAMALAEQLALPLVTIVDTPGAEMTVAAEEGGLSAEIARCLATLSSLRVATLAVLAGEGGSGGALALLVADRVVCAQHGYLAAIAPEGASAILYRSTDRAAELAAAQGGASWELVRFGIVDVIVPERPSADREPDAYAARMGDTVEAELRSLLEQPAGARLADRERRYRHGGNLDGGDLE